MISGDWKSMFEPQILARGRAYWQQGTVTALACTDDHIHATVLGTDEYEVDIDLDNGSVVDTACTCPYAESYNCKHMAAVLFAVTQTDGKQKSALAGASWQDTLKDMTADQMRDFLQCILSRSKSLQEQLLLGYQKNGSSEIGQDIWAVRLNQILRKYRNGQRYLSDKQLEDFLHALDNFALDHFSILFSCGKIMSAFYMVCAVFEAAEEREEAAYFTEKDDLLHTCTDAMRQLLDAATDSQKEEMYNWLCTAAKANDYGSNDMRSFLFSYPWDEAHLRRNLELLDYLLKEHASSEYAMKKWLNLYEQTMRELHKTDAEIEAFWQQYLSYDFVRDLEVNRYMEAKDYEKAIALLKQEKQLSAKNPNRLQRSSENLIHLYGITGQAQEYQRELVYQLKKFPQYTLTYVKELHSTLTEEQWEKWKQKLLDMSTTSAIHLQLLAYFEQWSALFVEIQKTKSVTILQQYMKPLMKWDDRCTLYCYADFLNMEMDAARERNGYRQVFSEMATLTNYPGGKEIAKKLLADWKERYARRSAMLDEMSHAQHAGLI